MLQSQDKTVGSTTYRVTQLPASQALTVLTDLVKMLGPSIGILVDGVNQDGKGLGEMMNAKLGGDVFGKAVESLAMRLDNSRVQDLINRLADKTQVDREGTGNFQAMRPIFDLQFAGKLGELFGWMRFALEVNYSDFLPFLANLGQRASATAKVLPVA